MMSPNSVNILLILICLLLRFSIGHSLQVKKSTVGSVVKLQAERRPVKAEEMEMEERERFGGGGRKMESGGRLFGEASSTTSGGNIESGESNGEGQGCMKRKFSKRSSHSMSGFVSWNADYHVPGTHPPRSN